MPKSIAIQEFMTPSPHTIGADIKAQMAAEIMRKEGIRHLPVQSGGKLVGILSDRDMKLALSFGDPGKLTVEDIMTPDPYSIGPETPLLQVITEMADHKIGSALVQDKSGKVIGIFTAIDALKLLREQIQ